MSAASAAGIADLISSELDELRQFVDVLRREQTALAGGNTDSLMGLAEQKLRHADRIAQLHRDRDIMLRAAGLGAGRDGLQAIRESAALPRRVQNDLVTLIELAKEARHLNDTNGKLVSERMQHNQKALSALMSAAQQSTVYGPDGHAQLGSSGRTLGSA